jgi:hypothetical protein
MRAFNIALVKQYVKLPSEFELDVESFNRAKLFVNDYILLPVIGQTLYTKLANTFIEPITEWQSGDTAVIGDYYEYEGAYWKALTATNTNPIAGANWSKSQLAYLWAKKIVPAYCYSLEFELFNQANANLEGNSVQVYVTDSAVLASREETNRKRTVLTSKREVVIEAIKAQLREYNYTLDGILYPMPKGMINADCCYCNIDCSGRCHELDRDRNINRNGIFSVI